MDYSLQIQKILVKVGQIDLPDDKIKLLKEATSIADAHNDLEWGFDLRLDIMDEEFYTSHDNESFAAFAWLLNACDQHPDLFDEDELLWKYKWMISAARNNAGISLQQIDQISDDFKTRLQRNGYSLRAYYGQKFCFALYHLQDYEKAKEYAALHKKELRDDMSDCRACELDDEVSLQLALNNVDEALSMSKDLFSGKLSCSHVPFMTYCSFVEYFNLKKDMQQAADFFTKAEQSLLEMENDSSQIGNIGLLISSLAKYNEAKAWEYFEQYIHWSLECNEYSKFRISACVLPLLNAIGAKTLNVNSAMPWYRPDGHYDLQQLYAYYDVEANELAKRFDQRNGNNNFEQYLNTIKTL